MSQKTVRRVVAAGVLTILLGLAGSAPAEARELRGTGSVGRWLAGLWQNAVSVLWPGSPATENEKQGAGTDPNGRPLPPSATSCGAACDAGYGVDPNGKP